MTGYWLRALAACWLGLLWVQPAAAHSSSTAYLDLAAADDGAVRVQWRIALRDLDALLDLDADGDGRLRWGEVLDRAAADVTLAHERLHLRSDAAACRIDYAPLRHVRLGELGFVQLDGQAQCRGRVALRYALFDGVDPTHRVLLQVDGGAPQLLAPGGTHTVGGDTARATLWGFVRDGVGHILGGVDHLLFLVALLLPAVVTRTAQGVVPRHDLRAALIEAAWIATAFTLAHSLTLACATFGWLRMPAAVIEPLVALTVLAAALNNLWPVVTRRLAAVAFLFGLVHGFAFAEVLAPLELPGAELARALLGFNLGVEAGQLLVVAASFAMLAWAARWRGYTRWVLRSGSAGVAMLALLWLVERVVAGGWLAA